MVGPTFYGVAANRQVNSVNEATTIYDGTTSISDVAFENLNISVFPNPTADLIAIQINGLVEDNIEVDMIDVSGKVVSSTMINKGSTIAYFDVQTVYEGIYLIRISNGNNNTVRKVIVTK